MASYFDNICAEGVSTMQSARKVYPLAAASDSCVPDWVPLLSHGGKEDKKGSGRDRERRVGKADKETTNYGFLFGLSVI